MQSADMVFLFVVLVSAFIVIGVFFFNLRKEKIKAEQRQTKTNTQRRQPPNKTGGIISETAQLTEKIDVRTRKIDDKGNISVSNESYQLVFTTKTNKNLCFNVTKQTLKAVPFNERGLLTYKGKSFIKFKYSGGIIEDK
ncbi:MAG: DUF2500 domain-containing protein [Clostridiales bacterium]|jgi:hypothetical protein|nr:DUF2500 domain-containing protein [Clostridiales bacterium]